MRLWHIMESLAGGCLSESYSSEMATEAEQRLFISSVKFSLLFLESFVLRNNLTNIIIKKHIIFCFENFNTVMRVTHQWCIVFILLYLKTSEN